MEVGSAGQFDVLYDGQVVASKEKVSILRKFFGNKGFPDEAKVIEALRAKISAASGSPQPAR
jgi:hypothetical protein